MKRGKCKFGHNGNTHHFDMYVSQEDWYKEIQNIWKFTTSVIPGISGYILHHKYVNVLYKYTNKQGCCWQKCKQATNFT